MKNPILKFSLFIAILALAPTLAFADCMINGHISVEESNSPLGAYEYTLTVNWDMDSQHGLSHLDLVVDAENGTCGCDDFSQNINFPAISGTSSGDENCTIEYSSELACDGDPSIDYNGILFKFEPMEADCEPGPSGTGSFIFYSDLAGAEIDEQVIGLVDKAGLETCTGTLSGVFPSMECDPVATDTMSWDSLKGFYR